VTSNPLRHSYIENEASAPFSRQGTTTYYEHDFLFFVSILFVNHLNMF